jgi:hypothetical protein
MAQKMILCLILLSMMFSCKKVKSYLQEPETQIIGKDLQMSYAIAYSANVVLTEMAGNSIANVTFTRSNQGFPCTTLSVIKAYNGDPFLSDKIGQITIAGLWSSADAAVFTIIFTNFNLADSKYSLIGINTFPLVRQDGKIIVAYGAMDIDLNPNSDALLSLNLTNSEVESEYARTNQQSPTDVYVAVEENGYVIDINNNNTTDITDDIYSVTGGGQVLALTNTTIGIFQQAMVGVEISSNCPYNPTKGYALLRKLKTNENNAPELGTALFEFNSSCDGHAKVTVGTGIYLGSIDKSVGFSFD